MYLDTLIANQPAKETLVRLSGDGRLPHAILLEGPKGSGRFTLAKAIAAMGVCRQHPPGCGECTDCKLALGDMHPDVEIYAKADAPGTLTIKSLRTINQTVATPPVQGRRRVVILRDIQDAAQLRTLNTLLKVLEEPPDYLMFVITTDNRENILSTILSRCLTLRMQLPSPPACAAQALLLCGNAEASEERAFLMASLCAGNIGRTTLLLSDTPQAQQMDSALEAAALTLSVQRYPLLRLLRKYERDRPGYREFLFCLREIFAFALREKLLLGASDARPILSQLSGRITARQGVRLMDGLDDAAREGQYNLNLPLALTRLCERLCSAAEGA